MITQKIYVASSWRNELQQGVVSVLRKAGYEVYDFKENGFTWSSVDPNWEQWTNEEYLAALEHPSAVAGYNRDMEAMEWADTFVLVQPCGRSAHLELGWACGKRKKTVMFLTHVSTLEPELMAKMADYFVTNALDLLGILKEGN